MNKKHKFNYRIYNIKKVIKWWKFKELFNKSIKLRLLKKELKKRMLIF